MKRHIYRSFVIAMMIFSFTIAARAEFQMGKTIHVIMKTNAGDVILELYIEKAPLTVLNFMKYVESDYYKDGNFYRTVRGDNQAQNNIKIGVIQGGRGANVENSPFTPVPHETTQDTGILHKDGVISMARLAPGTAESEFFICVNDQPPLDFGGKRNPDGQGFAAFGKVIKGMEVIRKIQDAKTIQPKGDILEYTSGQMIADPIVIYNIVRITDED